MNSRIFNIKFVAAAVVRQQSISFHHYNFNKGGIIKKRRNYGDNRGRKQEPYKVNHRIKAKTVRVVSEDGQEICSIEDAMRKAKEAGLDLVEISPNATPPVCKIIDYSKFKYEQKKRQKELKAKAHKTVLKEIRFGPNTDDHDFNFKLKHAMAFLKDGNKVKAYVQFVGRSIIYKERGEYLLLKFIDELSDFAKVEQAPVLEGKRMSVLISPKPTQKK